MSRLKQIISESTLMPLSLVVTVALCVAWISGVAAQGLANAQKIDRLEAELDRMSEMRERIARIEAKIDFLVKVEGISK
jgi:type II secretory pathway component PulJ